MPNTKIIPPRHFFSVHGFMRHVHEYCCSGTQDNAQIVTWRDNGSSSVGKAPALESEDSMCATCLPAASRIFTATSTLIHTATSTLPFTHSRDHTMLLHEMLDLGGLHEGRNAAQVHHSTISQHVVVVLHLPLAEWFEGALRLLLLLLNA